MADVVAVSAKKTENSMRKWQMMILTAAVWAGGIGAAQAQSVITNVTVWYDHNDAWGHFIECKWDVYTPGGSVRFQQRDPASGEWVELGSIPMAEGTNCASTVDLYLKMPLMLGTDYRVELCGLSTPSWAVCRLESLPVNAIFLWNAMQERWDFDVEWGESMVLQNSGVQLYANGEPVRVYEDLNGRRFSSDAFATTTNGTVCEAEVWRDTPRDTDNRYRPYQLRAVRKGEALMPPQPVTVNVATQGNVEVNITMSDGCLAVDEQTIEANAVVVVAGERPVTMDWSVLEQLVPLQVLTEAEVVLNATELSSPGQLEVRAANDGGMLLRPTTVGTSLSVGAGTEVVQVAAPTNMPLTLGIQSLGTETALEVVSGRVDLDFREAEHGVTLDLGRSDAQAVFGNEGGTLAVATGAVAQVTALSRSADYVVAPEGSIAVDAPLMLGGGDVVSAVGRAAVVGGSGEMTMALESATDGVWVDAPNGYISIAGEPDSEVAGPQTVISPSPSGGLTVRTAGPMVAPSEERGEVLVRGGDMTVEANFVRTNELHCENAGTLVVDSRGTTSGIDHHVSGNDLVLFGGSGNDYFKIDYVASTLTLSALDGNDEIYLSNRVTNGGMSHVDTGRGNDFLWAAAFPSPLSYYNADGSDLAVGGNGTNLFHGNSSANDTPQMFVGGGGIDSFQYSYGQYIVLCNTTRNLQNYGTNEWKDLWLTLFKNGPGTNTIEDIVARIGTNSIPDGMADIGGIAPSDVQIYLWRNSSEGDSLPQGGAFICGFDN